MKIAFVNQPWNILVNPNQSQDSIAIITHKLGSKLKSAHDVIIYGKSRFFKGAKIIDGVCYRFIPVTIDDLIATFFLKPFKKFRNVRRPIFSSSFYYLTYALQIAKDLRKQNPDIVHIHTFPQFISVIKSLNPKPKIILHMHDNSLPNRDPKMIEKQLKQVDMIFGCSNYITNNIRMRYPTLSERCQTVYNGVDIHQFRAKMQPGISKRQNSSRLLYVGRISPEKGVHILIDALKKVLRHIPQAHLEIIGPNWVAFKPFIDPLDEDEYLIKMNSFYDKPKSYSAFLYDKLSSDIRSHVTFTGRLPHLDLAKYYQNADVLVNPSLSEAFGMSMVEAMACEIPVVGTRAGGMTEIIINGRTGLLVERNDSDALANAILRILSDDHLRRSMAHEGRKRVIDFFSWECIAEGLIKKYESLVK